MQAVFSAWRATNDLTANMAHSNVARHFLNEFELSHWDAVGTYQEATQDAATQEVSHIVKCDTNDDLDAVLDLAAYFEQDCIMCVQDDNTAHLLFQDGSTEHLGTLQVVDRHTAHAAGHYTYFRGAYFICE